MAEKLPGADAARRSATPKRHRARNPGARNRRADSLSQRGMRATGGRRSDRRTWGSGRGSTRSSGPCGSSKEDELTDRAAALTYYGVLAIFPAILALVSVLGQVRQSATQPLIDDLGKVVPSGKCPGCAH